MANDRKNGLTNENVERIFLDCLFKENELIDGKPIDNFCIAEGIVNTVCFHEGRLNQHKKEIEDLIDKILDIGQGIPFAVMCESVEGYQWTSEHMYMEQLMLLGVGSEVLVYPVGSELWDILPGGLPYIIKNREKIGKKVEGLSPSEFPVKQKK